MNKTLCDLYDGQLLPREHLPQSSDYTEALHEESQAVIALEKHLGPEKGLLETVLNHVFDRTSFEIDDAFCQGFRIAFQLAAEAFLES